MLNKAIKDEKLSVVRLLLELDVDVNYRGKRTALHFAAYRRDGRYAKTLLAHGADVSRRDNHGNTALHQAVINAFEGPIVALLEGGADVNARHLDRHDRNYALPPTSMKQRKLTIHRRASGMTSLMLACGYDIQSQEDRDAQERIISLLLKYGGDASLRDENGRSSLHHAPSCGNANVLKMFIAAGVDPNEQDDLGMTALHHVAEVGDLKILEALGAGNTELDVSDRTSWAPVLLATKRGHAEFAKQLVKMGCEVSQKDQDGISVLHFAAQTGDRGLIELLIDRGAATRAKDNYGRGIVQHFATCKEGDKTVEELRSLFVLLSSNSDQGLLNAEYDRPSFGLFCRHTAISETIVNGNWKLFRVFRAEKARLPKEVSRFLTSAIEAVQPVAVSYLLENGAKLEKFPDAGGSFAYRHLPHVNIEDLDQMLQQLTAVGFDINESNSAGQTMLSTTCERINRAELVQVLVKNGADPYRISRGSDATLLAAMHDNLDCLRGLLACLPDSRPEHHWSKYLVEKLDHSDSDKLTRVCLALKRSEVAGERDDNILVTALHEGQSKFAECLVAVGMNPDVQDQYGWTALHHAILKGHVSLAKRLLLAGAKVNIHAKKWASDKIKPSGLYSNSDWTGEPLHVATLVGEAKVVAELLDRGADANASTNSGSQWTQLYGPTALHIALGTGKTYGIKARNLGKRRLRIARMLVEMGASVAGVGDHLTPQALQFFKGYEDLWDSIRIGITSVT